MIRRRIVRYEFVMSDEEFWTFNLICDANEYAYGYYVNSIGEYIVVMNSDVLYSVERALEIYIGEFEFDYECEVREISAEDWRLYDSVKELYNNITNEEEEEEC